ncbi:hypothetical protein DXG01_003705 [Tephrocybe rancida]|nr:hypothetical protein DXG01_003705 [Tephrocybe rancida]
MYWALNITMPHAHALKFAFSLLALIPLVNLHDHSTHELALRIGGSKAGLVNASLSNIVSIVVAITALRKCHLTFVQSTLMGSMLSKLLLVLGLCFFAGGTRFSEQGFDPTAVQLHSSLLSLSVGALFLPAAYHFALSGTTTEIPDSQKKGILHMSHGPIRKVSILLLLIYAAYLVFQLWSHTHLYSDARNGKSLLHTFSSRGSKPSQTSQDSHPEPTQKPVNEEGEIYVSRPLSENDSRSYDDLLRYPSSNPRSGFQSISRLSLTPAGSANSSQAALVALNGEPTVKLVPQPGGYPMSRVSSARSGYSTSSASTMIYTGSQDSGNDKVEDSNVDPGQGDETGAVPRKPRVGLLLAILVLVVVTVVASVTADWLVDSMDGVSESISKEFVGLILLPAVTSLAECMTAVNVSVKDELSFSIGVAVGSAIVYCHSGMDNGETLVTSNGPLPVARE